MHTSIHALTQLCMHKYICMGIMFIYMRAYNYLDIPVSKQAAQKRENSSGSFFLFLSVVETDGDVPVVIHLVPGICRVSRYSVLLGLGKIISPSKFNFFQSKILNRIVNENIMC